MYEKGISIHSIIFEIITEYYKDLHKYNIDKQEEKKEIVNLSENISKSTEADKSKTKEKFHSDSELNKLKSIRKRQSVK